MPWPKGVPHRRSLTDDDLEAVAFAPAEEPTTALAGRLGKPYFTVAHARQKMRRDGGWVCPLAWTTCTECGQSVGSDAANPRTVHRECERARSARFSRERRAADKVPVSTPFVAAWRRREPERNRELRERDKARLRAQWPTLPGETRDALLDRVHAADRRDYPLTLEQADDRGERWTDEEDRYVLSHLKTPARDVALVLGRTLWAVRHRRVLLRRCATLGSYRGPRAKG